MSTPTEKDPYYGECEGRRFRIFIEDGTGRPVFACPFCNECEVVSITSSFANGRSARCGGCGRVFTTPEVELELMFE